MNDRSDPAVREAVVAAGRAVAVHRRGTERRLWESTASGYSGDVVVRALGHDDLRRCVGRQTHRIAIRVDTAAAKAHHLPADDASLDAWLAAQEHALDHLWHNAPEPVFDGGLRLALDVQPGGDHHVTGGGHRMSLTYVFRDSLASTVTP